MTEESPREIAVRVLAHRETASLYIEQLLDRELARHRLSGPDRGLCQELVFGITRWQRTLDWLLARKTGGRNQNVTIRFLVELGLYQMFWLQRIPDHAAVHETVELGKRLGFGARAGFLNAVLRGYARERDQTKLLLEELKQSDPALGYSHPEWLVRRWEERWGREQVLKLLQWNNSPAPVFARLNRLKTDFQGLEDRWRKEGVEFDQRNYDWVEPQLVFELRSHPPLGESESFQDGFFYVQDPSTLLAVEQLSSQPGETILDLCAAPGGKTTFIAQRMENRGRVVACDVQPGRLQLVQENCARLGVTCVETSSALESADEAHLDSASFGRAALPRRQQIRRSGSSALPGIVAVSGCASATEFDRILVDAPCSNTGVLRRRVDLRWRVQPTEIARLRKAQLSLLAQAAPRLKPGGVLVYSTCSMEPEENQEVVKEFLGARPQFQLEAERQLLPFTDDVDGAYVARLKKQITR